MISSSTRYAESRRPPKLMDTAVGSIIARKNSATGIGTPKTVLDLV
jgi:hypothetical protein